MSQVVCPVCKEGLPPEPVRCRVCETDHHADCWGWVGRCGRYGCGSALTVDGAARPPWRGFRPGTGSWLLVGVLGLALLPWCLPVPALAAVDPAVEVLAVMLGFRLLRDL